MKHRTPTKTDAKLVHKMLKEMRERALQARKEWQDDNPGLNWRTNEPRGA